MGWAARFLTAVSFLAAGALFAPEALLGGSGRSGAGVAAARLAHILSFATAWGAALWVTFIGGIVMFKYLPRHQFGNLQGKMFPAYFMLISVCSAISVAAFAYLHPWKTASTIERYQLGFLIAALGFDLSNLLVFTPITIEMLWTRLLARHISDASARTPRRIRQKVLRLALLKPKQLGSCSQSWHGYCAD